MKRSKLPAAFLRLCKSVTAKRPKTVIDHILKHGQITTEQLKTKYGYDHPPRAIRDVKEHGIPIDTFRVTASNGRKIAAYRFGDPKLAGRSTTTGRTVISKALKRDLLRIYGPRCAIYQHVFPERELQVDHRIPFEVGGDPDGEDPDNYMLLCGSANRAKSWSCEHCANWHEAKQVAICRDCYWAYPDNYKHVAMRPVRRLDITWADAEIDQYEELRRRTVRLQRQMPDYVKEVIATHLATDKTDRG